MSGYKECHHGNVNIFYTKTLDVFIGGASRGAKEDEVDLVIDLTGSSYSSISGQKKFINPINFDPEDSGPIITLCAGWKRFAAERRTLKIDWPDFGVPSFNSDFFIELYDALEKEGALFQKKHKRKMKVLIMCTGGHGRSGTMASIFCGLADVWKTEDVIIQLRKIYCENAVETRSQADLVSTVLGVKVRWQPPKQMSYTFPGRKDYLPGHNLDKDQGDTKYGSYSSDSGDYYDKIAVFGDGGWEND